MIMQPESVRVAVPFRPDGGWRDRLWVWCRPAWQALGWLVVECQGPEGPFNRAAAVNEAARGRWDVLVVIDADIVCPPPSQVGEAVALALSSGRLVVGYEERWNLSPAITRRLLGGWPVKVDGHVRTFLPGSVSSFVAVPRRLWEEVGGMDERFVGWGCEDTAFVEACERAAGSLLRVPGEVWHLWHDRAPERPRGGQPMHPLLAANKALVARYRACDDWDAMRQLLAEPGGPLSTVKEHA